MDSDETDRAHRKSASRISAMKSKFLTTGITAFAIGAIASTSLVAQQRR